MRSKLSANVRLRVIDPRSETILAMLNVQAEMAQLGHRIGRLQLYGLALKWNAPADIEALREGRRNAFLRCSVCGKPGILTPALEQRGRALTTGCYYIP